jgi:aspartate/glutamate racemase
MKCQSCGGAVILISGKGSGYYGCYNARRKSCHNTLLVPRKRIEQIILQELQQKLLTTENLEYIFKNIEKLAAAGLNEVPELTQKKKAQVETLTPI